MDWDQKMAEELAKDIVNLHKLLAEKHANLRGSHEAIWMEAQGGRLWDEFKGRAFNHLEDAKGLKKALENVLRSIKLNMSEIARKDFNLANEMGEAIRDLRELARSRIAMIDRSLELRRELALTNFQRLESVLLRTGSRTFGSLTSSRLSQLARNLSLVPRGIASTPLVREVIREIEELPVSVADAARVAGAAVASARAHVGVVASRVTASPSMRVFGQVMRGLFTAGPRIILLSVIIVDDAGRPIGPPGAFASEPGGT